MKGSIFDHWAEQFTTHLPLKDLENALGPGRSARIAIDAEHFISKYYSKEPLGGALGGDPLSLEEKMMVDLALLTQLGCQYFFYFHGCDYGHNDQYGEPFKSTRRFARNNAEAFDEYENAEPARAINIFRENDPADMSSVVAWLKSVLTKRNMKFVTAPYSAYSQMIHALNACAVDMYYASSEMFLFGAGQVVTSIEIRTETTAYIDEAGNQRTRATPSVAESFLRMLDIDILCSQHLHAPDNVVRDTMFLCGSGKLPLLPAWDMQPPSPPIGFPDCVAALMRSQGNVRDLIYDSPMDPKTQKAYWEDYMKIGAAVTHMVVQHHIDEVVPCTGIQAPGDLHLALGLRMPEELNHYMFVGLISPTVLNWLNDGVVRVTDPFVGGNDETYRTLVKTHLNPWRRQSQALVAVHLTRYFQSRDVKTDYWFDRDGSKNLYKLGGDTVPQKQLNSWRVSDSLIGERSETVRSGKKGPPRSLTFALQSLEDTTFATKTIGTKPKVWDAEPLLSGDEIICNVIWRMLYLRGYINDSHQLTPWSRVVLAALSKTDDARDQTEAVFVAVELLRLGYLKPKTVIAQRGEDLSAQYTWFVSLVASCGQMVHQSKGYSGPLSRPLLIYQNNISAVRSALRDLTEMTMANLFLGGDGKRLRDDQLELARTMPFQGRFSCGLGIITNTYLDTYNTYVKAPVPEDITMILKEKVQSYFAYANVNASLERGTQLWDALLAGVRASDDLISEEDKSDWEEINKWFDGRRPDTTSPVVPDGQDVIQ